MLEKFYKSQPQPVQPNTPGVESRRFPLKPVFLVILILFALITISGGVYYLYARTKVPPKETPTVPTETKKTFLDDLFILPGWHGIEVIGNGSGARFSSRPEANWLLVQNENSSSWLTVNGDFEVQFKVSLGEKTQAGNSTARLQFFNRTSMAQSDYETLELWIKEGYHLDLNFVDGITHEVSLLASGQMPASGELKIQFENVGSLLETVKISTGESQIKILEANLPSQFFKEGGRLSFGFEVGNGIKSLTVSDFKISGKVAK